MCCLIQAASDIDFVGPSHTPNPTFPDIAIPLRYRKPKPAQAIRPRKTSFPRLFSEPGSSPRLLCNATLSRPARLRRGRAERVTSCLDITVPHIRPRLGLL
jgi:hypothetical protein